jgi:RNA polymerase sigma factor (sigma-70 family)
LEQTQLIKLCKKQDRKAQYLLYTQYSKTLYNICMRIMPDSASAADMLQEGFISIFQKLDKFNGNGSFEGWMKKLMVHTCIDGLRRDRKMPVYYADSLPDTAHNYEVQLYECNIDLLINVVEQLPQGYKMIFSLYAIEGYDHEEISQILSISEQTSKSQYHRAKQKIREIIEQQNLKDKILGHE